MIKPRLTFRNIEMVEAIAKLGSLSAAARALGLSQPALTQALKAIETELGVKLFSRGTGCLVPTAFAKPFLTHVDQIRCELLEAKRDLLVDPPLEPQTELRISAGIRSCAIWVDRAVSALRRTRPEIKLSIDHHLLNLYERLINGEVDIGVSMVALLPAESSRLVIEPLGQWRALFVCSPEHPLATTADLSIDQLRAYPLAGHFNYPVILRLFSNNPNMPDRLDIASGWPTANLHVDTLDSLIGLVTTRDCLAIVSKENVERELAEGSLVELKLEGDPKLYVQLVLAYLNKAKLSNELLLFIDAIKSIEALRGLDSRLDG
jgi:DNA-binding transcriptional LysR family regulator